MGLTAKQEEKVRLMPQIETRIRKSRDGQYLVHQTVITYIKPMKYYKAIVDNAESVEEEDIDPVLAEVEA